VLVPVQVRVKIGYYQTVHYHVRVQVLVQVHAHVKIGYYQTVYFLPETYSLV
jgi:hypothetical protein